MHSLTHTLTHTLTHSHMLSSSKYRGQDLREGKWKVSDLVLTYSLDEQEYELYNEFQFMYPSNIPATTCSDTVMETDRLYLHVHRVQ